MLKGVKYTGCFSNTLIDSSKCPEYDWLTVSFATWKCFIANKQSYERLCLYISQDQKSFENFCSIINVLQVEYLGW